VQLPALPQKRSQTLRPEAIQATRSWSPPLFRSHRNLVSAHCGGGWA
jgi:hypothetical protein